METKAYTILPIGRRWQRWTCCCGATGTAQSRRLAAGAWRNHHLACPERLPVVT